MNNSMVGMVVILVALASSTIWALWRRHESGRLKSSVPAASVLAVTAADIGGPLGTQATLLQFSTAFCQPCRPTRRILAEVAEIVPGVTHVDVDAESNLALVRRLRVTRTPTIFILDPEGAVRRTATGIPRKAEVIAALNALAPPAGSIPTAAATPTPPEAATS